MRIGLVSDTHDAFCDWPAVLASVTDALRGVDLVLHCGDVTTVAGLDDLEAIAPVLASRSEGDPPASPPRLVESPRVVEAGEWAIGLSFSRPEGDAAAAFGRPVDAVVFGGTHASSIEEVDGLLYVGPGSPSLSNMPSVAVLTLVPGQPPSAEIIAL